MLNDELYFIAPQDQTLQIMEAFNFPLPYSRRILMMGGGNIALTLGLEIEKSLKNFSAKIIEKDPERAEYIARHLTNTEVLCKS